MSEPKRYTFEVKEILDASGMVCSVGIATLTHPMGNYVRYEDYARLKAQVERLEKAGDALAGEAIRLEYSNYWSEYEKVEDVCIDEVEAWHKAKGVQS